MIFVVVEESEDNINEMFIEIEMIDDLRHVSKDFLVDRSAGDVIEGQGHVDVVNITKEIVEISIISEGDARRLTWIGFLDSFQHLLHSFLRQTRIGQERNAEVQFTDAFRIRRTFARTMKLQLQDLRLQLFVELQEFLDRQQLIEILSEEVLIDDGVLAKDVAGGGVISMSLSDAGLGANQCLQFGEFIEIECSIPVEVEHLKGDLKVAFRRGENRH